MTHARKIASLETFAEQSYEAPVPFWVGDRDCGEVKIKIKSESIELIERSSFFDALKICARSDYTASLGQLSDWFNPSKLPFAVQFDPTELKTLGDLPLEDLSPYEIFKSASVRDRLESESIAPSPFGGAINYRVNKEFANDIVGGDSFSSLFDSFVNMNGLVLESQLNYYDGPNSGTGWFRGDTRLVKDFQAQKLRTQVGDVYPQAFGLMSARAIGGVLIASDFALDPYLVPFPQGQGSFVLRSRSQVRTYVNGVLVKSDTLPAGNYDIKDVPLINGLNEVEIQTEDEFGEKKVYRFNLPTSVEILNKGVWKYSVSSGMPFLDQTLKRVYEDGDPLTSTYAQYGFTRDFSLGGYAQNQGEYFLTGLELGKSTRFGNFFLGGANSTTESDNGMAMQSMWQLQRVGKKLFSTLTFSVKHQRYSEGFRLQEFGNTQSMKSRWQASVSLPLQEKLTTSFGVQWADVRDPASSDRKGYDGTLNLRASRNLNLSFYLSRQRDERNTWNNTAYAFLTWSFDNSSRLITSSYDFESETKRLTGIQDNGNRLYSPKITGTIEEGPLKDSAEFDATLPVPIADLGIKSSVAKYDNIPSNYTRTNVRFAQAFVFAYGKGRFGAGFSRPVPNSFALFNPSDTLKKQKVSLRSSSAFTESSSGLFGEIAFSGLLPYQYREIQLDPSALDDGTTLERERFVLYPTYRSAHLIPLLDRGVVILTGFLKDKEGKPLVLQVGNVGGLPFFTSREGRFFIEGLSPGEHLLKFSEKDPGIKLQIAEGERGVRDLGALTYLSGEN
jgi:outer membrane usher protein FimD/PapC